MVNGRVDTGVLNQALRVWLLTAPVKVRTLPVIDGAGGTSGVSLLSVQPVPLPPKPVTLSAGLDTTSVPRFAARVKLATVTASVTVTVPPPTKATEPRA